jgi:hypothetical protein
MNATTQKPDSAEETIARLEKSGDLDPSCQFCVNHIYRSLREGRGLPFAPGHKASWGCLSGRRAHCTCNFCF